MPRKLTPYEPTAEDLAFVSRIIRVIKSGGVWGTSCGVYQIDHEARTATLIEPADPWDNPVTLAMHHRHHYVWAKLGYRALPAVDWDAVELPDEPEETTR